MTLVAYEILFVCFVISVVLHGCCEAVSDVNGQSRVTNMIYRIIWALMTLTVSTLASIALACAASSRLNMDDFSDVSFARAIGILFPLVACMVQLDAFNKFPADLSRSMQMHVVAIVVFTAALPFTNLMLFSNTYILATAMCVCSGIGIAASAAGLRLCVEKDEANELLNRRRRPRNR